MDWLLNLELFKLNLSLLLLLYLIVHNLVGCWCLNSEGLALLRIRERVKSDPGGALLDWNVNDDSPCSWFGVGCSDGRVEFLNLKDLSLEGALAPELGMLSHVKYLILRNNSFSGIIPKEIGELKKLEILDLGYNNLSGKVPPELCNILTLKILVLSNNINLGSMFTELNELSLRSELHIGENVLADAVHETPCDGRFIVRYNDEQAEDTGNRRLLQNIEEDPPRDKYYGRAHPASPSPSSTPSVSAQTDYPPSPTPTEPAILDATPPSFFVPFPYANPQQSGSNHKSSWIIYLSVILGVSILSSISVCCVFFCRYNKVVTVRPWVTGLSGQLQKAFVTGVPSLKRSELETACEDFSNIIGTSPDSTLYKGTLSSGVEIAVMASAVTSAKDWSKHSESQFRKKIATLSKVNHKNFVNLLGYCEEEEPFTRMMVFEYAPNGTLFEHLHVKEAEHLDWGMRLRIAMGMAYCLEHMYQLNPPVFHNNLNSTTVYLTDDYAAKISDFSFWNKTAAPRTSSGDIESSDTTSSDAESNVYNFGLILLEMMTGKVPSSDNEGPLVELSEYMRGVQPIRDLMDPTLRSFQEDETSALCSVILSCTDPDTRQRPTMREVTAQLREITAVTPDGATPKLSPLWWAELEILPSGAS